MSAFSTVARLSLGFKNLASIGNRCLQKNVNNVSFAQAIIVKRECSTNKKPKGLMEFFDDEKNWGNSEVKSGRSWKKDELRIKSNTDLHKLWYVLLKERNMLLTMEEESKNQTRLFPSPERLDKVEESMENLEEVVRERNRAYYELETGTLGERQTKEVMGPFGFPIQETEEEHLVPKHLNKEWHEKHDHDLDNKDVRKFLALYKEKERSTERKKRTRDFNHVIGLLKRFPDMDMEALKEQYPDVDIEKAKNSRKCRGHFVPK